MFILLFFIVQTAVSGSTSPAGKNCIRNCCDKKQKSEKKDCNPFLACSFAAWLQAPKIYIQHSTDVIQKKEYFTFNDNRTIKNLSSLFSISPNMAKGQFINVETPDRVKVKQQVNKWYFRNAKIKFHSIAQPLIFQFKNHKVDPSSIVMSDMPTR